MSAHFEDKRQRGAKRRSRRRKRRERERERGNEKQDEKGIGISIQRHVTVILQKREIG
jgi:hypothetical protein